MHVSSYMQVVKYRYIILCRYYTFDVAILKFVTDYFAFLYM